MAGSTRFQTLVAETIEERRRVRGAVARQHWREAEPEAARFAGFMRRRASLAAPRGAEALQGDTVDFQAVAFLTLGAMVHRAVGYVEVSTPGVSGVGTGFLVSPSLFLTNQHVIADEAAARGAQVFFDRENDEFGRPRATTSFTLDPDRFSLFSREEELDYALVAVGERLSGAASLAELRYCALSNRPDRHVIGMNVNIIQHPGGAPKMISVRNNLLEYRTARTLLYETDTDHGSSGAPVFNDLWEVIALHHYGEPFLEKRDETGAPIPTNVNEGVRISAIYDDLERRKAGLTPERAALLETALAYDRQGQPAGRALSPPRPSSTAREMLGAAGSGRDMTVTDDAGAMRVTLPLEISVRLGSPAGAPLSVGRGTAEAPAAARTLARGAEKLQVDADYANRRGYDPSFLPGVVLPLPELGARLGAQLAPLRPSEPNAEEGELKYEHFSIKLNKSKRIAIFTATNIDGAAYLDVDRRTGQVGGAEGETWFTDPRVSASFCLDQSFYSAWSTIFDRGHLTRRTDPTWGSEEEAERANADTYHFTNCSPQHFRFNESATYWQGAERYVLERGALAADEPARLVVFQGPIFADEIDRWADDVQIPSSFFKVVVWKGRAGLRSVGLVVDQSALLDETRVSLGKPRDVPVNVNQWRVPVATIEARTGLSFGADVRAADTIKESAQPRVGEALILLRSLDDLLR